MTVDGLLAAVEDFLRATEAPSAAANATAAAPAGSPGKNPLNYDDARAKSGFSAPLSERPEAPSPSAAHAHAPALPSLRPASAAPGPAPSPKDAARTFGRSLLLQKLRATARQSFMTAVAKSGHLHEENGHAHPANSNNNTNNTDKDNGQGQGHEGAVPSMASRGSPPKPGAKGDVAEALEAVLQAMSDVGADRKVRRPPCPTPVHRLTRASESMNAPSETARTDASWSPAAHHHDTA